MVRSPVRTDEPSPGLSAVDAQQEGVGVFALHRNVAGGVPERLADDAKAAHGAHQDRSSAPSQAAEVPPDLVRHTT